MKLVLPSRTPALDKAEMRRSQGGNLAAKRNAAAKRREQVSDQIGKALHRLLVFLLGVTVLWTIYNYRQEINRFINIASNTISSRLKTIGTDGSIRENTLKEEREVNSLTVPNIPADDSLANTGTNSTSSAGR